MKKSDRKDSLNARNLAEANLDSLVAKSTEGEITDTDEALVNITGIIDRSKESETDFFNYFTDPELAHKMFQEVFDKGSVINSPLSIRHKNGKLIKVLFNGSVNMDESGNIMDAVVGARDLMEQKWAMELSNAIAELKLQNEEKEKRAEELVIANKELLFQNKEKEKRAEELVIANKELVFQNKEKAKREKANKELKELSYSLKQASQYARSLIEASTDPLVTISAKGKITDVNEALIKVTGLPRENLIGTDFSDYFTEPQKARKGYKTVFEKSVVANYPLTIKHKNGKLTDVLYNASVYKDDKGKVLGVFAAARDVTKQNRISGELNEAKIFAELATILAEDAKTKAEEATKIAENAVKAKQQFLSNMSHEIRTPMNAIIGFTKVLLKTGLTEKQDEYLNAIKMSGDALIVLINDILDLAKVDSGKMTFEQTPFRIASSISSMLHLFETKILEQNLVLVKEYDSNIPEILLGDSIRLHQIILNLVSNAVKFTNHGKITLAVRLLKEETKNVTLEFEVKDTGIGIAKNKLKTIFENFQQASSGTSRLYGGTGLGLAIVKQLVDSQGGSIKVSSKVGEGSTFSFTLNFQKTKANFNYPKYLEENGMIDLESNREDIKIKNIKVLVVEDIALNQLLMRTLLDDYGFDFDIAANGKIAVDFLKSKPYDIVLMDLQMPVMNGFEAAAFIRKKLKSDIPIIALTADVTTVDLAKCKEVGMNDYLAKPVDERLLYTKMLGLVNKPVFVDELKAKQTEQHTPTTCIDLNYLKTRTKSNSALMIEIIGLYLEQTPLLIEEMNQSLQTKDWDSLKSAAHKMIPSFVIVGLSKEFENMAKNIQEYAQTKQNLDQLPDLVATLRNTCTIACKELKIEVERIKNTTNE